MPKSVNRKCKACAFLPVEEAKRLHGQEGDGCWNPSVCWSRRSYYLKGRDKRLKRLNPLKGRKLPAPSPESGVPAIPTEIVVEMPKASYCLLYIYRGKTGREDVPFHALSAELRVGGNPVCRVKPVHAHGYTNGQIKDFGQRVLQQFSAHSGTTFQKFAEIVYLPASACPIEGCSGASGLRLFGGAP